MGTYNKAEVQTYALQQSLAFLLDLMFSGECIMCVIVLGLRMYRTVC